MALFDNFNAALLGGLGIGTRIGDANQQQRQDDARLKLAYAQMEQQNRARMDRLDLDRQSMGMRQQDQLMRQRQQSNAEAEMARARDQMAADQQLNAREYRGMVTTPRLAQAAQTTDWSQHGAGLLDEAQAAQGDLEAFGRAGPQAQAQTLAAPRAARTMTQAAEIRRKMADITHQQKTQALWSNANTIPLEKKRRMQEQIDQEHLGITSDLPMSEQEYTTSPAFALLPEQYRPWASQYFKAHGQPPPRELLAGLDHPQKQATDEARASKASELASKAYEMAVKEHETAAKALADFRAKNKDLARPDDMQGGWDGGWSRGIVSGTDKTPAAQAQRAHIAALQAEKPLREAEARTAAARREKYAASQQALEAAGGAIQSQPTIGGRQATPTPQPGQQPPQAPQGSPNAAADEEQQAMTLLDQLEAQFPDWHTNPQSEAMLRAAMLQQPAVPPSSPLDDETEDYDPAIPIR